MNTQHAVPQIRAFNRFYTNIIFILDRSVLNSGFSLAEARILYEIGQLQPCSARKIMNALNIDEGYLSRILNKFVSTGMVLKEQSDQDKRKYFLTIAAKGERHLDRLEVLANESISTLIKDFSDQDLSVLLASMQTIHQLLANKHDIKT